MVIPMILVFRYSLLDNVIMNRNPSFVGLNNYAKIFSNSTFWIALYNTLYFTNMGEDLNDIVSIGECMVELYSNTPIEITSNFEKTLGGDAFNLLSMARRLGSRTRRHSGHRRSRPHCKSYERHADAGRRNDPAHPPRPRICTLELSGWRQAQHLGFRIVEYRRLVPQLRDYLKTPCGLRAAAIGVDLRCPQSPYHRG